MDVDAPATSSATQPFRRIQVGDSSPYDLDQVATTWQGRSKITRLLFVAQSSPSLAGPALSLALSTIQLVTLDTDLYQTAFHLYRQHVGAIEAGTEKDPRAVAWWDAVRADRAGGAQGSGEVQLDRAWIESARREAQSGKDKLEVELKGYQTNLIKESIRMGYRDLARFQYKCGDLQDAVKSYTKSREFCTTSQHVLDMCLGVIEIALDMSNYAFVRNYVIKAESAVDAAAQAASGSKPKAAAVNLPGMVAPQQDPLEAAKERDRRIVQERLTVAGGVAHLGSGAFEKAARAFTDVGSEAINAGVNHFIPAPDIALYAVLTSLACFDRSQLRTRVLENANLRPYLDLEPYLREIVRAFFDSKFKLGLELLAKHEHRLSLDVHLAPHVATLQRAIRQRALLAYFQPYGAVSLARMAAAFGVSDPAALEGEVVDLIASGQGPLKARIDSVEGVLVERRRDRRGEAFRKALQEGEQVQKRATASQLRMKLLQAEIVVKGSRSGGGGGGGAAGPAQVAQGRPAVSMQAGPGPLGS